MAQSRLTTPSGRQGDRTDRQIADSFADMSYLGYLRPTPRPFMQFVSGHFPPGTLTQQHSHPCIALHGCLHGPLTLFTDQDEFELDAGVFYLLAPGVRHHWRNAGRQTAATMGVLIDAEHPGRWPAGAGVGECCLKLTRLVRGQHRFSVARDDELQHSFWLAADHLTSDQSRESMTAVGALLTLLGQAATRLEDSVADSAAAPNDVAQQVRRLLLSRVNDRISISQVARELGVSPTRAKESFREAFGCGIVAYHNQLKIWQAKRFLCDRSLTVEQVSKKLGFSSHSYFSRVFLQHTGERPIAFRSRNSQ